MIQLRLAGKDDCRLIFDWRNDQSSYRHYIDDKPVLWPIHVEWLNRSLSNPDRQIYMAEEDGVTVGMIRSDKRVDGYELSWVVGPEHRGKRYGHMMLSAVIDLLSGNLYARIKADNDPSLALVRSFGFACINEVDAQMLSVWALKR